MVNKATTILVVAGLLGFSARVSARQWTLHECINYALANNITLQKSRMSKYSAIEDYKQSKAALLPSLSASTSQNISYNPWPEKDHTRCKGQRCRPMSTSFITMARMA